jgi:hypothetical protein
VEKNREAGGGWALGKVTQKEDRGGIGGKVIRAGQLAFLWLSYRREPRLNCFSVSLHSSSSYHNHS